jgi:Na+-translocating ferredoxin:NAD+ oxidoreductase RnfD subunit
VNIANRANKLPVALAFLGSFYGLATLSSLVGSSALVAELFRVPDVNALLFLALFMLGDPPTSPTRSRDQMTFGLIAASASYALLLALGAVYFLPAGALFANAWETLRRLRS